MKNFSLSAFCPVSLLLIILFSATLSAAPPEVTALFPPGAQAGTSVVVKLTGTIPAWPVQVWSSSPDIQPQPETTKGEVRVAVPAGTPPQIVWFRFFVPGEGVSPLRPFVIGNLPEITESTPNESVRQLSATKLPVVINGRLEAAGDADSYLVLLKKGERLVASLNCRAKLGSPMDAILQISEIYQRRGKSEAAVLEQNHDSGSLDPQIIFVAPKDGNFVLRVFGYPSTPNSTIAYAGSPDSVYRLTLTTGPFVEGALPLSIPREQSAEVQLFGWNLPEGINRLSLSAAKDLNTRGSISAVSPPYAGMVDLQVSQWASAVDVESDSLGISQSIELPVTLSGRFEKPGDVDTFAFSGQKGRNVRIRFESRGLGYPAAGHLEVQDEQGKVLSETDAVYLANEPELVFTPPASGRYTLLVRDRDRRGGERFFYRATLSLPQAECRLAVTEDRLTLTPEKALEIPVSVDRRDGFQFPVSIRIENLPPGVTSEPVISEPTGDSSKSVKLILKLDPAAGQSISTPIKIIGEPKAPNESPVTAVFNPDIPLMAPYETLWLTTQSKAK